MGVAQVSGRRLAAILAAVLMLGVLPAPVAAADSGLFSPSTSISIGGSFAEAVAVGDVNGDGLSDVVLTTSFYFDPAHDFKLYVFLQQPNGELAPPILYPTNSHGGSYANSVQIGDVNGDGRQDIIVGNTDNIEIFLQQSDGTLAPSVVYATLMSRIIRVGDVNNDGRADVVGLDWNSNNVAVFLQNAGGTLDPAVMYNAPHAGYNDLDLGDVNGDGLTDIVVMSGQTFLPSVVVLTQAATGGFNAPVSYSVAINQPGLLTHGVAVGDVNGDGRNDVVVTYGGNVPNSKIGVFYQNAAGGLNPAVSFDSTDLPQGVEIADVNRDGRSDIVVFHNGSGVGIYLQNTDGSLQAEEIYYGVSGNYQPQALSVGDFNGDRLPDIAVVTGMHLGMLIHTALADVVTTASAGPDPVFAKGILTYSVSISNQGPDAARNLRVSASVPGGVTIVSTSPECTVSGGTWQCTVLRLDAGATSDLQLAVQPQTTGSLVLSVSAVSNASDPYAANNIASITTTVLNSPPVANAGADQTVRHNTKTVTLDGRGSYDPDGTIASYQWQQLSGFSVTLSNASSAAASFSMPKGSPPAPISLVFRLTVTDNAGSGASDTVTITVTR